MRAEQFAIAGEVQRLRRAHRRLHLRVTSLLIYVSLILLAAVSCDSGGRETGPSHQAPASASGLSIPWARAATSPRQGSASDNTMWFTLPDGGSLSVSVPVSLSEADAGFAAVVVGDYLTSLAARTGLQR